MSDYTPTLMDIKVALIMGFRMPDGQDAGDALDDYIEGLLADEVEKCIERMSTWLREQIGGDYPFGTIVQGMFAAARGDGA
jgi:hypothetical protein